MKKFLTLAVAAAVTGCAVGPDYQARVMQHPESYGSASEDRTSNSHFESTEKRFWQGFGDPLLAELINDTLHDNLDLQAMMARYRSAEALLNLRQRDQWPSLTAFAQASDQKLADVEQRESGDAQFNLFDAGAALHWELDLFGRLSRATEAARANSEASAADLQALQVAVAGQLVNTYWQLRGLQAQLRVVEQNVALQESSLDIVSSRLEAGRGTVMDVLRARAQLNATRAGLPEIRAEIASAMHRIAVLSGRTPRELNERLSTFEPLPEDVLAIAEQTPGDVLRRRPDIRAAERRVAAATARIGVATADLFPRFTLQGLTGSLAASGGELFSGGSEYRRVVFGIDWTFLDRAQVHARIDAADAEASAQLADYRHTVLLALEETETWLVRYQQAQARVALLKASVSASEQAVDHARSRYEQGYIDYFELLSSELELTRVRDALVRSETQQALTMVNVYRSLAGAPALSTPAGSVAKFGK